MTALTEKPDAAETSEHPFILTIIYSLSYNIMTVNPINQYKINTKTSEKRVS
jgi:hypothetical protein